MKTNEGEAEKEVTCSFDIVREGYFTNMIGLILISTRRTRSKQLCLMLVRESERERVGKKKSKSRRGHVAGGDSFYFYESCLVSDYFI